MSHVDWDRTTLDLRFAEALRCVEALEQQRDDLLADLKEIGERADLIMSALPAPRLTVQNWHDAHGQAGMISAIAKVRGQ